MVEEIKDNLQNWKRTIEVKEHPGMHIISQGAEGVKFIYNINVYEATLYWGSIWDEMCNKGTFQETL
jgi:hypothetical protein